MKYRTIVEAAAAMARGETTSCALVRACLQRARDQGLAGQEGALGSFITLLPEERVLSAARASDRRRQKGTVLGPVDGIPIAVKDNFCMRGVRSTAASKMLHSYVAAYESTATERLAKKAGAVIIGTTNMDEFAMGSASLCSAFGPVKNPRQHVGNTDNAEQRRWLVPGGSSGGERRGRIRAAVFWSLGVGHGRLRAPACGVLWRGRP